MRGGEEGRRRGRGGEGRRRTGRGRRGEKEGEREGRGRRGRGGGSGGGGVAGKMSMGYNAHIILNKYPTFTALTVCNTVT